MPPKKKRTKPHPTTAATELAKKTRAVKAANTPLKDFPTPNYAKAPRAKDWNPPPASDLNALGQEAFYKKPRWSWTPDDQGQLYTWEEIGPLGIKIKPPDGNEFGRGACLSSTPGAPFPSSIVVGMRICLLNGEDVSNMRFKQIMGKVPEPNTDLMMTSCHTCLVA